MINSGLKLFALAIDYASKIAKGDPEYTLEKAEKIFPSNYFIMVNKEYSSLMKLAKYNKDARMLQTAANRNSNYTEANLHFSKEQLMELKVFRDDWQMALSSVKNELANKDWTNAMKTSRLLDMNIKKLDNVQASLDIQFSKLGSQNKTNINKELEILNRATDTIVNTTLKLKEQMIAQIHEVLGD